MKKKNATLATRIQHFALQQINQASTYLTDASYDTDLAIHETRRCLKRLRAVLRLVKAGLKSKVYVRSNRYFRDQGRLLSALRDATVMQTTLAKLRKQSARALPASSWKMLRQELAAHSQTNNKKKVMATVAAQLGIARDLIENWNLELADETQLRRALRKTYRNNKRAMKQALAAPTVKNWHEWRKQINHLRYQLTILRDLKLISARDFLGDCKALAQILGLNNDLAVLSHHLPPPEKPGTQPIVQQLIQTEQSTFTNDATRLGQQLYKQTPKAFLNRIWPV
ncbi:MAG: CHAD domain-containing protein [Acidobacteria bacterium]|nr:CHAD domain-containing protein [Acidobacteriota bacterium]